jgi:uncharacterized protein
MNTRHPITVYSLKYDKSIRKSWSAYLIQNLGDLLVLEGIFESDIEHPELGRIEAGTISIEYYWQDRWYSIFRFLGSDRQLRNYYCNLNMPPVFDGSTLSYVDLDLDVAVWPDGRYSVLDAEEFEENSRAFSYPRSVRDQVFKTLKELITLIEEKRLPS